MKKYMIIYGGIDENDDAQKAAFYDDYNKVWNFGRDIECAFGGWFQLYELTDLIDNETGEILQENAFYDLIY